VYAWLWRKLPFGLPGKLIGALGLAVATVALLWYVVFPWAEPILPFDDVQVSTEDGVPGGASVDEDIPYPTDSDNPAPSPSR